MKEIYTWTNFDFHMVQITVQALLSNQLGKRVLTWWIQWSVKLRKGTRTKIKREKGKQKQKQTNIKMQIIIVKINKIKKKWKGQCRVSLVGSTPLVTLHLYRMGLCGHAVPDVEVNRMLSAHTKKPTMPRLTSRIWSHFFCLRGVGNIAPPLTSI